MNTRFTLANIILLPSVQHIVGIVNIEWLKEKNLITEQPIQTFSIPGISVLTFNSYNIIVNDERLQIATNKEKPEYLKTIAKVVKEYVNSTSSLPFKALGFNFHFIAETGENKNKPDISIIHSLVDNMAELLPGHQLKYGAIIDAEKDDYLLQIKINPERNEIIQYSYNFHIELSEKEHEKIFRNLDQIMTYYTIAKEFTQKTSG